MALKEIYCHWEKGNFFVPMEKLGQGGFGTVYAGKGFFDRDPENPKEVAIKIANKSQYSSEYWTREVENTSLCKSKNSITLLDFFEYEGEKIIVFEKASGNLQNLISQKMQLEEVDVLFLATDLLSGLEKIHENEVIHRDITPKNVLYFDDLDFIIADYGISKRANDPSGYVHGVTCFKEAYPPEVLENGKWSYQSDIYQVGLTLLEALSGRHPVSFNQDQVDFEILEARILKEYPRKIALNIFFSSGNSLRARVAWMISKMLFKDKNLRYKSASVANLAFFGELEMWYAARLAKK